MSEKLPEFDKSLLFNLPKLKQIIKQSEADKIHLKSTLIEGKNSEIAEKEEAEFDQLIAGAALYACRIIKRPNSIKSIQTHYSKT